MIKKLVIGKKGSQNRRLRRNLQQLESQYPEMAGDFFDLSHNYPIDDTMVDPNTGQIYQLEEYQNNPELEAILVPTEGGLRSYRDHDAVELADPSFQPDNPNKRVRDFRVGDEHARQMSKIPQQDRSQYRSGNDLNIPTDNSGRKKRRVVRNQELTELEGIASTDFYDAENQEYMPDSEAIDLHTSYENVRNKPVKKEPIKAKGKSMKSKDKDKSAAKKKPKDLVPEKNEIEGQGDWFTVIDDAKQLLNKLSQPNSAALWGIEDRRKAGDVAKELSGLLADAEQESLGGGEYPKTDEFSPGQKTNVEMGTISEKKIKNLKDAALQQNKAMIDFNNKILAAMKII